MERITLISSDNVKIQIKKDALQASKTLWDMIESSEKEPEKSTEVTLNIKSNVLKKVVYLLYRIQKGASEKDLWCELRDTQKQYTELYPLACALNYLDIEIALNACIDWMAQCLGYKDAYNKPDFELFLRDKIPTLEDRNFDIEYLIGQALMKNTAFDKIFEPLFRETILNQNPELTSCICPESPKCNAAGTDMIYYAVDRLSWAVHVYNFEANSTRSDTLYTKQKLESGPVAISDGGKIARAVKNEVHVIDVGSMNAPIVYLIPAVKNCKDIAFHGDDIRLIDQYSEEELAVYDVKTNTCIQKIKLNGFVCPKQVNFIDSKMILTSQDSIVEYGDTKICLWDVATGECIKEYLCGGVISNVMISPDKKYLVCQGHTMQIFDAENGKLVQSMRKIDEVERIRKIKDYGQRYDKIPEKMLFINNDTIALFNDGIELCDWFNDTEALQNLPYEHKCFLLWLACNKTTNGPIPVAHGAMKPWFDGLPASIQKFLVGNGYCHIHGRALGALIKFRHAIQRA